MRRSPINICLLAIWLCLARLAHADLTIADDNNQSLHLKHPAQRVVTLAPHATELLYAIGAGSRIIGTVDFSDFPEEAKRVPHVGSYQGLDLEAIAALRPDVIIAWPSGNSPAQLEKLKHLGLPLYMSEPHNLAEIADAMERLGALTGSMPAAQQAAEQFRQKLAALRQANQRKRKVRVFYQVWDHPLMTINDKQIISDAIRQCGGENVFGHLPALTPRISLEALLQANPEAIIGSSADDTRPLWLDDWKKWPRLRAVQQDNLFYITADWISRPTPRMLQGVEAMCKILEKVRDRNSH